MNLGPIKDKTIGANKKQKTIKKAFTVTAVFCVAAIAVTYLVSVISAPKNNIVLENPTNTQSAIVGGDASITTKEPYATIVPEKDENGDSPASAGSTVSVLMATPVKDAKVLKGYSADSLVYSNTLKHWATHTAIDFACSEDATVLAALDGTVSAIYEDSLMGLTVKVSHSDGIETVYSCLKTVNADLKEGSTILKGQAIGSAGNTGASEASDGAHLHFEVLKNSKPVNPQTYLGNFTK